MAGKDSRNGGAAGEWARYLRSLSDEELVSTARDYLWLAEFGPAARRSTFEPKGGAVVAEMKERGLLEELRRLRAELAKREGE
jgi:hypothetical protein